MMDISEIIKLTSFAAAGFISLFCCLVMLINRFDTSSGRQPIDIPLILAAMFFCSAFTWFSLLVYFLHPRVFVGLHPAVYLAMLYCAVLLYRFVFRVTRTQPDERFNPWHYIIPLCIVGVIFVRSFSVPFDIQLAIIESRGEVYGDYKLYALLLTSKSFAFFVYNIVYSLFSFRRIRRYQKEILNYSADEGHSPVRWLYLLFFITLATLPLVIMGSFLGKNPLFYTTALLFPLIMSIFHDIIICYNVVVMNFKVIEPEKISTTNDSPEGKIDKEKFEHYIHLKKPYLDADLRITDMASDLLTNRAYLSAFINREYGMNFSRYINHLRLKELEQLRKNPDYAGINMLELVLIVGFSSYRGYLRTKNEE